MGQVFIWANEAHIGPTTEINPVMILYDWLEGVYVYVNLSAGD